MKSLKVFFTICAMGFAMVGFSQSNGVKIINDTGCDFHYVFAEQTSGSTNCNPGPTGGSGTIGAYSNTFVLYVNDLASLAEITPLCGGSSGITIVPPQSAHGCNTCNATSNPNSVTLSPKCCGDILIKWTTDCTGTESSTITISTL